LTSCESLLPYLQPDLGCRIIDEASKVSEVSHAALTRGWLVRVAITVHLRSGLLLRRRRGRSQLWDCRNMLGNWMVEGRW
jgi:hypothetical protein